MLVHGDEDGKSEVSIKEGSLSFVSVFENIKRSEDTVDTKKSKVRLMFLRLSCFVISSFLETV